jgi:hypothetical protein
VKTHIITCLSNAYEMTVQIFKQCIPARMAQ